MAFADVRVTIVSMILFLAISPVVIAQSLTSTLENGQFVCLGSRVTFTCETRGSGGIAWNSPTYIGPNGFQLRFDANFDNPGETRTSVSNVHTVATFTSNREDQGVRVLESTLSIIPLLDPQNASVTCIHIASDRRNITTFQVIDVPAKLEDVFPVPIKHEGNCVVHTVWKSPDHNAATQYEIFANGTRMFADTKVIDTNVNGTRMSTLFSISCGVYEISVSASNACGQTRLVSNLIPQTPPHSIPEPDLPTSQSTNTDNEVSSSTGVATTDDSEPIAQSCGSYVGAIIGVAVVLGLLCLGLSIILLVILCHPKKNTTSTNPTEKNQIEQFEMTEEINDNKKS